MPHPVITNEWSKKPAIQYEPLSIASAIHNHHHDKDMEMDMGMEQGNESLTIIAALLSMEVHVLQSRVTYLLGDPSLPPNTCAKIIMYGSSIVSWIANNPIEQGDILQWKQLTMKKSISCNKFVALHDEVKNQNNQLPAVICEFNVSWKHLEEGNILMNLSGLCPSDHLSRTLGEWMTKLQKWFQKEVEENNSLSTMVCKKYNMTI